MLTHAVATDPVAEFAEDVRAGLTRPGQKELPSKYLYDPTGSALFEVISLLPEYGLTRADERLLQRHAYDIVARLPRSVDAAVSAARTANPSTPERSNARTCILMRIFLNPNILAGSKSCDAKSALSFSICICFRT